MTKLYIRKMLWEGYYVAFDSSIGDFVFTTKAVIKPCIVLNNDNRLILHTKSGLDVVRNKWQRVASKWVDDWKEP